MMTPKEATPLASAAIKADQLDGPVGSYVRIYNVLLGGNEDENVLADELAHAFPEIKKHPDAGRL